MIHFNTRSRERYIKKQNAKAIANGNTVIDFVELFIALLLLLSPSRVHIVTLGSWCSGWTLLLPLARRQRDEEEEEEEKQFHCGGGLRNCCVDRDREILL